MSGTPKIFALIIIISLYFFYAENPDMPYYQPLYVNDIAPSDRLERRKWLAFLSVPFTIMQHKFDYGNNLGTFVYAWRIPEDEPVDNTEVSRFFPNFVVNNPIPLVPCVVTSCPSTYDLQMYQK